MEVTIKKPLASFLNHIDAMNAKTTSHVEGKINFGEEVDSMISFQVQLYKPLLEYTFYEKYISDTKFLF